MLGIPEETGVLVDLDENNLDENNLDFYDPKVEMSNVENICYNFRQEFYIDKILKIPGMEEILHGSKKLH